MLRLKAILKDGFIHFIEYIPPSELEVLNCSNPDPIVVQFIIPACKEYEV